MSPEDHEARERLARYMAHPPVALYRLHYDPRTRGVTYVPKNHDGCAGAGSPGALTCPALDFLAALCCHIPDAGHQLIRYYGQWSDVRRARAPKAGSAAVRAAPCCDTEDGCSRGSRRAWEKTWTPTVFCIFDGLHL